MVNWNIKEKIMKACMEPRQYSKDQRDHKFTDNVNKTNAIR